MSKDAISTIFTIEGLLILATILVGINNVDIIVNVGFYVLLPLFGLACIASLVSFFFNNTKSYRRKLILFFIFNLIVFAALAGFIYWDLGNVG